MKQNNLKVGEYVFYYSPHERLKCKIDSIQGAIVNIVVPSGTFLKVHYRNCFRLKPKKKPLEVYCISNKDGLTALCGYAFTTKDAAEKELQKLSIVSHKYKVVKFREVPEA